MAAPGEIQDNVWCRLKYRAKEVVLCSRHENPQDEFLACREYPYKGVSPPVGDRFRRLLVSRNYRKKNAVRQLKTRKRRAAPLLFEMIHYGRR